MNVPTIKLEDISTDDSQPPAESPPLSPELARRQEADARMCLQRNAKHRLVPIQISKNGPIRIHTGPRPNGKQVRKARAAQRRAAKAAKPTIEPQP